MRESPETKRWHKAKKALQFAKKKWKKEEKGGGGVDEELLGKKTANQKRFSEYKGKKHKRLGEESHQEMSHNHSRKGGGIKKKRKGGREFGKPPKKFGESKGKRKFLGPKTKKGGRKKAILLLGGCPKGGSNPSTLQKGRGGGLERKEERKNVI